MKLIKLTNYKDGKPIYINVETIGHLYQESKKDYTTTETYTVVGTTTHNNGGFKVAEDIEQILKLVGKSK
jgi:hypothetical protein